MTDERRKALEALSDLKKCYVEVDCHNYTEQQDGLRLVATIRRFITEPAVPTAVRGLPEKWRTDADEVDFMSDWEEDRERAAQLVERANTLRDCKEELERGLAQQGEWYSDLLFTHPATAPEGWKLVPVEPTEEMLKAGLYNTDMRDTWIEMLDAAPEPDSGEGDD